MPRAAAPRARPASAPREVMSRPTFAAFLQAAANLQGREARVLPGRMRLLRAFRRLSGWPPGSADVTKVIVDALRDAGLVRTVPNIGTELQNSETIGSLQRRLRSGTLLPHLLSRPPRAIIPRQRPRKQAAPKRALEK